MAWLWRGRIVQRSLLRREEHPLPSTAIGLEDMNLRELPPFNQFTRLTVTLHVTVTVERVIRLPVTRYRYP